MADGSDPASLAIGAGVTGAIALALAFVKGLFNRNVDAADKAREKMQEGIEAILLELRSMHDEQTRQRSEILALGKEIATVAASSKGAHERIDALVSPSPRRAKK